MEDEFKANCLDCGKEFTMSNIEVLLLRDGKINRKCPKCRNEFGR